MQRVERMYNATSECVDIYLELSHANGLCLAQLSNETRPDPVKRVRDHIGRGIQISCEDDGVWIYNHSDYPISFRAPLWILLPRADFLLSRKFNPVFQLLSLTLGDAERCWNVRRLLRVGTSLMTHSPFE